MAEKPSGPYTGLAYSSVGVPATSCATVRDFIMISPTASPYSVRWSAIGDPTDWPTPGSTDARTKQSGTQVLPNKFGYVTAISGNDFYAYVFQERAITKATYIGGDLVFTFDTFFEGLGCEGLNRITRVDDMVFFQSESGHHLLVNDQVSHIGLGLVEDTY